MTFVHRLGLGTAQWGLPYGIANKHGRPELETIDVILKKAAAAGIATLDTASAYGEAERVLGLVAAAARGFQIVTKTAVGYSGQGAAAAIISTFHKSLRKMGADSIDTLLVHHGASLIEEGGKEIWSALQNLVNEGKARRIGVSVYAPAELEAIFENFRIDVVQLPHNLYDQRFSQKGLLDRLKDNGVEIHARSPFLQGVLLMPFGELPTHFFGIAERQRDLHMRLSRAGLTALQGALQFCLGDTRIDRVIVGCETVDQLDEIVDAAASIHSITKELKTFAVDDEMITLPTRWPPSDRDTSQKGTANV